MNIDLHCHSIISDGVLTPAELVRRAKNKGVDVLALTDHDELAGLAEAQQTAQEIGLRFINGVEISITWNESSIHIVGLRIDPNHPKLKQNLQTVRSGRIERAKQMAQQLDEAGIYGSFEGASAYAQNLGLISRTHFARFLINQGYAKDMYTVFQNYLIKGKPGYVAHKWAELSQAIDWIHASGGVAVVAHPGRYKLDRSVMHQFLSEFKRCGGDGIEVITGSHSPAQCQQSAQWAKEFDLLASRGSDFHDPQEGHIELGKLPPLPNDLKPVWHDWGL